MVGEEIQKNILNGKAEPFRTARRRSRRKITLRRWREPFPSRKPRRPALVRRGVRKLANLPNPLCLQTSLAQCAAPRLRVPRIHPSSTRRGVRRCRAFRGLNIPFYIRWFHRSAQGPAAFVGEGKMYGDGLIRFDGAFYIFPFQVAEMNFGAAEHPE